ncbi:MAG: hypothetical protein ACK4E2_05390 [Pseudothermotoga sp.]
MKYLVFVFVTVFVTIIFADPVMKMIGITGPGLCGCFDDPSGVINRN